MAFLPVFQKLKGRYEFQSVLAQGGMGVVYRAYDVRVKRLVAVKTIKDTPDEAALELFERECKILAQLSHPNVIEIFDVGEFEEGGLHKPYFVMPLLSGRTLEELMKESSEPLPAGRSIEILIQACRGLQSAHEHGLIHRDLKPSNIFVLDDDSVKIIDFGVAHMMSAAVTSGRKGTLWYMAPEQIEMGTLTPRCDQFALGVVCYQLLTGRRPFEGAAEKEVAGKILGHIPPPAHILNPGVPVLLSQVTAKALAKKPERRWESLSEFAICLRLAYHGGRIPALDPECFQPRLDRAAKAIGEGDIAFADEILREVEDAGCMGPALAAMRSEIDESRRKAAIQELLASARKRIEECEYLLAQQKVAAILELDPTHPEALALQRVIEEKHRDEKIAQWFRIANRQLEAREFSDAREAARCIIEAGDPDGRGRTLLAEIDRREGDDRRLAETKEELYRQALGAWQEGNLSSALSRLEKLLDLDTLAGEPAEAPHQELYDRVCAEKDGLERAYAKAGQSLARADFDTALAICGEQLEKYPANLLFQALHLEVVDARRRRVEEGLAECNRRLAAESDLDRRVEILEEAVGRFPGEAHIRIRLESARERRNLLRTLAAAARSEEAACNYEEALRKWIIIQNLQSQYPAVDTSISRLKQLSAQQSRLESRGLVSIRVTQQIEAGRVEEALSALAQARLDYGDEPEFTELERRTEARRALQSQALDLLAEGRALWEQGRRTEALARMRAAQERDSRDSRIRSALVDGILELGRAKAGTDWPAVRIAATEALALSPDSQAARNLLSLAEAHVPESQLLRAAPTVRRAGAAIAEATPPRTPPGRRLRTISEDPESSPGQPPGTGSEASPPPARRPPAWERLRSVSLRLARFRVPARISAPSPRQVAIAGAVMVLILLAWGAFLIGKHRRPVQPAPARVSAFSLRIRTTPADAAIRVDHQLSGSGDITVTLAEGDHYIEAALPGYRTEQQLFRVGPRRPAAVDLKLLPEVSWRLYTDAADARVALDGGPPSEVKAGRFDFDRLQPGEHAAVVSTPAGQARYTLEVSREDAAASKGNVVSQEFLAALAEAGPQGVVLLTSRHGTRAAIGTAPPVAIGEDGLRLPAMAAGNYEVTLLDRGDRLTFPLEVRATPTFTAFVHAAGKEAGAILLHTEEAGAEIFVDNRKLETTTNQGETRLPGLSPGAHSVRIAKQGFEPVQEQTVKVAGRKTAELHFTLNRQPALAAQLAISGSPAGAAILLDQVPLGAVAEDGSASFPGIAPGQHSVELRHAGYTPKTLSLQFEAGQTISLSGAQTTLVAEAKPATIQLTVSPPEASVVFSHPNEPPRPADTHGPITLPKGTWVFAAQAEGYVPSSVTVTVGDGESKEVPINLVRSKPAVKPDLLSGWQHPERWTTQGGSYVHEGGGYVLFDSTPIPGSVAFTAALPKGKRLRWVVSFQDDANYTDCELDGKHFERYQTVKGKRTRLVQVPLEADLRKPVFLRISIQKGSLRQSFSTDGNKWREIDVWTAADQDFPNGRFGFILQGKDTLVLSAFSYLP